MVCLEAQTSHSSLGLQILTRKRSDSQTWREGHKKCKYFLLHMEKGSSWSKIQPCNPDVFDLVQQKSTTKKKRINKTKESGGEFSKNPLQQSFGWFWRWWLVLKLQIVMLGWLLWRKFIGLNITIWQWSYLHRPLGPEVSRPTKGLSKAWWVGKGVLVLVYRLGTWSFLPCWLWPGNWWWWTCFLQPVKYQFTTRVK